jgi:hypothetical protein
MHLVDAGRPFNSCAKTHRIVFSNDLYSRRPKLISRYRYFRRIWRKPFRALTAILRLARNRQSAIVRQCPCRTARRIAEELAHSVARTYTVRLTDCPMHLGACWQCSAACRQVAAASRGAPSSFCLATKRLLTDQPKARVRKLLLSHVKCGAFGGCCDSQARSDKSVIFEAVERKR